MANEIGLVCKNKIAIRRKVFLAIQYLDAFCVEGATQEKFREKDCLFAFSVVGHRIKYLGEVYRQDIFKNELPVNFDKSK